MTGTETFTVISTEDLEQTSGVLLFGKMDIVDGYIIENLLLI
ncbi:Uncharacterised protein [Streptococcus pneumoniae]|nr:Uncharacterised protein [Streptococcus pneumoniae]VJC90758.1 Uncharacterised protein [Streptococcus pneumoniae]VJD11769.1 Uncharacterised protein [Streptococcus pneumoniae]VJN57043.1 Uncharacterised protein [Streptococcus pneumoniae]VTI21235.1 Uncharacterised protein [Streptococcus pneumoniae]